MLGLIVLALSSVTARAQTPPPKPTAKPSAKNTQPAAQENIPSPVSRHYPILILAHGNEPSWSLRLGMKGPERLDRVGYPPIVLDPGEITADQPGRAAGRNGSKAGGIIVS